MDFIELVFSTKGFAVAIVWFLVWVVLMMMVLSITHVIYVTKLKLDFRRFNQDNEIEKAKKDLQGMENPYESKTYPKDSVFPSSDTLLNYGTKGRQN